LQLQAKWSRLKKEDSRGSKKKKKTRERESLHKHIGDFRRNGSMKDKKRDSGAPQKKAAKALRGSEGKGN